MWAGNRRVLVVADVGGPLPYHAGDEAILTATRQWWRRCFPHVEPVALSKQPAFTAAAHGVAALKDPSVPEAFASAAVARAFGALAGLIPARTLRWAARVFPDAAAALLSLKGSALLHVAGGGNLTSDYPRLLLERSVLAVAATAFKVPVMVTGQQVGPRLTPADEQLLKTWLPMAAIVGVRDRKSAGRCIRLGVAKDRLLVTGDDALRPGGGDVPEWLTPGARPRVGLSLHHHGDRRGRAETLRRLAAALGPWLQRNGADAVLLPHVRSESPDRCDAAFGKAFMNTIGGAAAARLSLAPESLDVALRAATGACDFVVTTRFHGAVFALSAGVPAVVIAQEDYTSGKLAGLLDFLGLPMRVNRLDDDDLPLEVETAWKNREAQRARLETAIPAAFAVFDAAREEVRRRVARLL